MLPISVQHPECHFWAVHAQTSSLPLVTDPDPPGILDIKGSQRDRMGLSADAEASIALLASAPYCHCISSSVKTVI